MKLAFCQMKPITKGDTGGVVKELLDPNPESLSSPTMYCKVLNYLDFKHATLYVALDDQDEIMSRLIARNKLHLHQAFDTPFAQLEIQNYIGEFGTGKGSKKIIEGNFDSDITKNTPAVNYWIKNNIR
eukprot:6564228-Ditylum_brightwellii.AAC.1